MDAVNGVGLHGTLGERGPVGSELVADPLGAVRLDADNASAEDSRLMLHEDPHTVAGYLRKPADPRSGELSERRTPDPADRLLDELEQAFRCLVVDIEPAAQRWAGVEEHED